MQVRWQCGPDGLSLLPAGGCQKVTTQIEIGVHGNATSRKQVKYECQQSSELRINGVQVILFFEAIPLSFAWRTTTL